MKTFRVKSVKRSFIFILLCCILWIVEYNLRKDIKHAEKIPNKKHDEENEDVDGVIVEEIKSQQLKQEVEESITYIRRPTRLISEYLSSLNAFLINVDVLEEIKNASYKKQEFSFDYILQKPIFGVFDSNSDLITKNLKNNSCQITKEAMGYNSNALLPTIFFLKCDTFDIQLSVFYKRGEYYWIGDDKEKKTQPKWFGDVPRALNDFNLTLLADITDYNVLIPSSIDQFLFDYKHSKFVECNKKYAQEALNQMGSGYTINPETNLKIKEGLKYVKSVLENYKKPYWLAAGTLLGWYRDCGIIPYTTDADLAIWDYEYEDKILQYFRANNKARLGMTLGLIKEGFELRLLTDLGFTIDLFLMYKVNNEYQWNGYQGNRVLYRQLIINFNETNLCSGELLDNKFIVPCNPEDYLSFQYGSDRWRTPLQDQYFNYGSISFYKNWTDAEWPYCIRWYDVYTGKVDVDKTLSELNRNVIVPYVTLPQDPYN